MKKKLVILFVALSLATIGGISYFANEKVKLKNEIIYSLNSESHNVAKGKISSLSEKELLAASDYISDILIIQIYDGFTEFQAKKVENALAINDLLTDDTSGWKKSLMASSKDLPKLLKKIVVFQNNQKCSDKNSQLKADLDNYLSKAVVSLTNYSNTGYNFYYNDAVDYYNRANDITYVACDSQSAAQNLQYEKLSAIYSTLKNSSNANIKKQFKILMDINTKQTVIAEKEIKNLDEMIADIDKMSKLFSDNESKILQLKSSYK